MPTAFLVLCHRPPRYLAAAARRWPQARFFVHYDAKAGLGGLDCLNGLDNVHILRRRVDVHWAGFSMVDATLRLIGAALTDPRTDYFHLISGDCVLLQTPERIEAEFARLPENALLLQSRPSRRLAYRLRFNTPHADTVWQRSLAGKVLTKCFQAAAYLPPRRAVAAGSQWFSATRAALLALLEAEAQTQASAFFRRKLCPDEHFFQYLAAALPPERLCRLDDNRRLIRFSGSNNHPETLTLADLQQAAAAGYWLARKTDEAAALAFLNRQTA